MAVRFAAGASIPFGVWLVLLPLLGAWGAYGGGTIARPIAVVAVACVAGGVLAGSALARPGGRVRSPRARETPASRAPRRRLPGSVRWQLAFGAAFCVAGWMPLLLLGTLPALGGRETAAGLAVVLAPGFALAYAMLGGAGLGLGGAGWRNACRGALVFGAAGAAGGALLAVVAGLAPGAVGLPGFGVQSLGGGAAYLLPAAAGGWWIGRDVCCRRRQ